MATGVNQERYFLVHMYTNDMAFMQYNAFSIIKVICSVFGIVYMSFAVVSRFPRANVFIGIVYSQVSKWLLCSSPQLHYVMHLQLVETGYSVYFHCLSRDHEPNWEYQVNVIHFYKHPLETRNASNYLLRLMNCDSITLSQFNINY